MLQTPSALSLYVRVFNEISSELGVSESCFILFLENRKWLCRRCVLDACQLIRMLLQLEHLCPSAERPLWYLNRSFGLYETLTKLLHTRSYFCGCEYFQRLWFRGIIFIRCHRVFFFPNTSTIMFVCRDRVWYCIKIIAVYILEKNTFNECWMSVLYCD